MNDRLVVGIDIGSTYTKTVLIDEDRTVRSREVQPSGFRPAAAAERVYGALVAAAGVEPEDVTYVAATGYGRYMVPFRHTQITELTSHAYATHVHSPAARTLLDIGGQDIKAVRISADGRVRGFRLNDKCAAGTGAFVEKNARYLGLATAEIGPRALQSTKPVAISSVCAVFAESEVIGHLAAGETAEDILAGVMESLAERAMHLVRKNGVEPDLQLAGGMTNNPAMVAALEREAQMPVTLPPDGLGQLNGAYGAALLGLRRVLQLSASGHPIPVRHGDSRLGAATRRRWSTHVSEVVQCTPSTCPTYGGGGEGQPVKVELSGTMKGG